jgi:hypothetical protein
MTRSRGSFSDIRIGLDSSSRNSVVSAIVEAIAMQRIKSGTLPYVVLLCGLVTAPAIATESGTSFYLLGQRGQNAAGVIPVEGVFLAVPNYYYSGDISGSRQLPVGGSLALGVDAGVFLTLPTAIWATPVDIAGGKLALSGTVVYGQSDITARGTLEIPGIGVRAAEKQDDRWSLGDPVFAATIGWIRGATQISLVGSVNIPIGDYEEGRLANVSLNRWVGDITSAFTWRAEDSRIELSGAAGFTLNGKNDETDYESGNEIHLEAALFYHLSPKWSFGLNSYYQKQVSGDSGAGAALGSFKGQVFGIGPGVTANFMLGESPVSMAFRYFVESNVENRMDGEAAHLMFSMPLKIRAN